MTDEEFKVIMAGERGRNRWMLFLILLFIGIIAVAYYLSGEA